MTTLILFPSSKVLLSYLLFLKPWAFEPWFCKDKTQASEECESRFHSQLRWKPHIQAYPEVTQFSPKSTPVRLLPPPPEWKQLLSRSSVTTTLLTQHSLLSPYWLQHHTAQVVTLLHEAHSLLDSQGTPLPWCSFSPLLLLLRLICWSLLSLQSLKIRAAQASTHEHVSFSTKTASGSDLSQF